MSKEIVIAVVAGSSLGLVIAFGIWKGNSLLKIKKDNPSAEMTISPNPTPNQNHEFKIVLAKPNNLDVITDTPVVISGLTSPNSFVAISGEDGDVVVTASESGSFTSPFDLIAGANQIMITAFTQDGGSTSTNLTLAYSSQFTPDSSGKKATSFIGTVTDITGSVIQIKNDAGDIEQITPTTAATFVDIRDDTTKTIKLTDIAIGDYLIAMGYKNEKGILDSSRILVSDPLKTPTRKAFFGKVSDSTPSELTLTNPKTNEKITITPNKYLEIVNGPTRFSGIEDGDKIIAIGEFKNDTIDARTIEVIK